ncbi:zinc-binding domain-containing protein [Hypoxylon fragiforme]|uniref:zinc-binding domain-containing protein n=1 Tax=Hypoxylon fragiforme TaxID=63214 RepID=UPI0020C6AF02|nr:zinc-binding domain-containing protein [Hypoxylon fragiforme]KAI2609572.1 zinc-binding domain-containing protein [Hypoxylon fragiforme]
MGIPRRKMPGIFFGHKGLPGQSSYTYPSLHPAVVKAAPNEITDTWFKRKDDGCAIETYATHVMGDFQCRNIGCLSQGWSSKMVAIEIRWYSGNGYNATVFGQRCRACNEFGGFDLNTDSYAERVSYRLKKWKGIKCEKPPYNEKQGKPHLREFCEGCRLGICREGD